MLKLKKVSQMVLDFQSLSPKSLLFANRENSSSTAYSSDDDLVQKNTTVIVSRVPVITNTKNKPWKEIEQSVVVSILEQATIEQTSCNP